MNSAQMLPIQQTPKTSIGIPSGFRGTRASPPTTEGGRASAIAGDHALGGCDSGRPDGRGGKEPGIEQAVHENRSEDDADDGAEHHRGHEIGPSHEPEDAGGEQDAVRAAERRA